MNINFKTVNLNVCIVAGTGTVDLWCDQYMEGGTRERVKLIPTNLTHIQTPGSLRYRNVYNNDTNDNNNRNDNKGTTIACCVVFVSGFDLSKQSGIPVHSVAPHQPSNTNWFVAYGQMWTILSNGCRLQAMFFERTYNLFVLITHAAVVGHLVSLAIGLQPPLRSCNRLRLRAGKCR